MPEEAQYAYMATRQALENAKMDQDFLDKHTVGIIYGNDSVAQATMEAWTNSASSKTPQHAAVVLSSSR